MLLIRVHPSAARIAREPGRDAQLERRAPGLRALLHYEAADRLHRVVPLDRRARAHAARRGRAGEARAGLLGAAHAREPGAPHTGHLLVQVRHPRHRAALARRLAADPHIAAVAPVAKRYLWAGAGQEPGGGLLPPERLWNHHRIQLPAAKRLEGFRPARLVRVAVLDSGVQIRHPALRGRTQDYVHSYDLPHGLHTTPRDIVGHGTHVAGIINAIRDHRLGIEGICHCRLTVMKVFDDRLDGAPGARVFLVNPLLYRAALELALARRFDVLNLSLGGPAPPDPHEAALLGGLLRRGTTIVAAMGNAFAHRGRPCYPAASPGVIAVGATGPDDTVASFSCRGRHITLTAPGIAIWSTLPTFPGEFGYLDAAPAGTLERRTRPRPLSRNTRFDSWPGTSGACPHVTAAVALLLARRPRLTPAQVKTHLMRSADKVPGMRGKAFDPAYGAGRLNIRRLLASA